jgi:hypothetical protein
VEAIEAFVLYGEADLNWFAAYFAVFNVGLAASGQVQNHRDFFSAIWTGEFVFHWRRRYSNRSGMTTVAARLLLQRGEQCADFDGYIADGWSR